MEKLYMLLALAKPDAIPKAELNSTQLASIVSGILGLAGVVAVIFVIIGGIKYVISQGEPAQLQKAKETIIYALVGLAFVMFAFVIVRFVVGQVFK